MESLRKSISGTSLTVILATMMLFACTRETPDPAVATMNGYELGLLSFLERYDDFLETTNFKDNLKTRHIFLHSVLDEHLLLNWADTSGMTDHPLHQDAMRNLDEQILLNLLYRNRIRTRIEIREEELRELYQWSKNKIHVRHLFARSRGRADSLFQRLRDGEMWESLAREVFHDPVLAGNGGDLGFLKLGDMDQAFELAAFQLRHREVSPPVRTSRGYSIIQVLEREYDPFLTEEEFQKRKSWLRQIAFSHRKHPEVRAYTDSVAGELAIDFLEEGLAEVWQQIDKIHLTREEVPISGADMPCVRFEGGEETWTVGATMHRLAGLPARRKRLIDTEGNLKTTVSGLIIQEKLLKEARAMGLQESEQFKKESLEARNGYLISEVMDSIYRRAGSGLVEKENYYEARRRAFVQFRDELKDRAEIRIDSSTVKEFVLIEEQ